MRMRSRLVRFSGILVIAGCAVLLESTPRASSGPFQFTAVDVEGATLTVASGINAGGDIVGWYVAGGRLHGFVSSGGIVTPIDFPSIDPSNPVVATDARGIGPGGDIVGSYRLANESTMVPAHGYLLTRSGTFYRLDHHEHTNTIAQRILPDGTVLGCYHDTDTMDTMHGMITNRAGVSGFDMGMTMHNGATPDGKRIVGVGNGHGYLLEGDTFTSFDVPNSLSTAAWDINARREIVGVYTDAERKVHGFMVKADWQFTTIDFPGATTTRTLGINSRGDVVGAYVSGGITHGYIGRRTDE